jgi:acyl-CoA synthetase (AMP-forming)/AMP-acid ligase II
VSEYLQGNPSAEYRMLLQDQITYFTLIAGILRAGYQVFPVSPRNSDAAIAHLLQSTGCNYVFVSADSAMQKLAGAAATKIVALGGQINLIPVPSFVELYDKSTTGDFLPPMRKLDLEAPAVILHSSGRFPLP